MCWVLRDCKRGEVAVAICFWLLWKFLCSDFLVVKVEENCAEMFFIGKVKG